MAQNYFKDFNDFSEFKDLDKEEIMIIDDYIEKIDYDWIGLTDKPKWMNWLMYRYYLRKYLNAHFNTYPPRKKDTQQVEESERVSDQELESYF